MSQIPAGRWQAVSFDAGGTLIEPWPSVGHVYAAVAAEQSLGVYDPDLVTRRFLRVWERRGSFNHTKAAWRAVVSETFAGLVAPAAIRELFEAVYERFAMGGAWRVPEDVRSCLEALRSVGLRLAVISNFDERLAPLLADLDLARYFDPIIASGPLALHKPDPGIFAEAARRLDLPPGRILHVGDSEADDLEGARRAGFGAVLLDRKGRGRRPDAVGSLSDLPAWIRRDGATRRD